MPRELTFSTVAAILAASLLGCPGPREKAASPPPPIMNRDQCEALKALGYVAAGHTCPES